MLILADRLNQQIRSAERALCEPSQPAAVYGPADKDGILSSVSPVKQGVKRRHTEIASSVGSKASDGKLKRTKTLKTYTSKRLSSVAHHSLSFDESRREKEDEEDSNTTRPMSSGGLPNGTIQTDFNAHEPNVMFRDTGSTIPDNASSEQRLLEQALCAPGVEVGPTLRASSSDEAKSSSFPWSASVQTESAKSGKIKQLEHAHDVHHNVDDARDDKLLKTTEHVPADIVLQETSPAPALNVVQIEEASDAVTDSNNLPTDVAKQLRPRSSPIVQIEVRSMKASSPPPNQPASTAKSRTKFRKAKMQDDFTDPLNSDDIAVGLPKERYKPRPSKRRATQILEEPIDYFVQPEKAVKIKRAKTVDSATIPQSLPGPENRQPGMPPDTVVSPELVKQICEALGKRQADATEINVNEKKQEDSAMPPVPYDAFSKSLSQTSRPAAQYKSSTQDQDGRAVPDTFARPDGEKVEDKPPTKLPSSKPASQTSEHEAVFTKPVAKPRPNVKSKRSHTTIFEDHVEFSGSQRLPTLRQQQTMRKNNVKNEDLPPRTQKGRQSTSQVADDGTDELARDAKDLSAAEEEVLPKKRGRGRPSKVDAKPKAKVAEKSFGDPEIPAEEPAEEEDEPPKKKGRGRPPKAAAKATKASAKDVPEADESPQDEQPSKNDGSTTVQDSPNDGSSGEATLEDEKENVSTPTALATSKSRKETPMPEKTAPVKELITPQKATAKSDPSSHSPIRSSSGVPLRVGLSKRQRIQPLLRILKR